MITIYPHTFFLFYFSISLISFSNISNWWRSLSISIYVQRSLYVLDTAIYHCVNVFIFVIWSDGPILKSNSDKKSRYDFCSDQFHYSKATTETQKTWAQSRINADKGNLSVPSYMSIPISYLSHTSNVSHIVNYHSSSI